MAETDGLKGLLSASQVKCLESEKKAKAFKELRERDDMLVKLEDENRSLEDKLRFSDQNLIRSSKWFQDAKSQTDCFSTQRDKEIAALRHSLGTKETFYKEIEYLARKLEQENQDLLASLKELQDAKIQEVGNSSSLAKLQNKLKRAEQMHQDCPANIGAKEAEWSSKLEKLNQELNNYKSALESKETTAKELEMELENCHSVIMLLELRNEEPSVMLLVLKSELTEAQLKHKNAKAEMNLHEKERDENVSLLIRQLEMKNTALDKSLEDNNEEHRKLLLYWRELNLWNLLKNNNS
ncbi:hypothetical protein GH714_016974 [Hevea brasiliensis]|uniref:Uncharacterized protein n=1 Tax=Hevea brasiliensis TaxID=3981 RepID=A0A6A6K734_HEVBR|nr:hypothetical protein GH714_016974 [Hevea brasiliensis]